MTNFTRYHLIIDRAGFSTAPLPSGYSIIEGEKDYSIFRSLIERVGGPWGWTRRPTYVPAAETALRRKLLADDTRLLLLNVNDEVVGYCLITLPASPPRRQFAKAAANENKMEDIIEIENFGFFPEHTGKGFGGVFLPEIFERLFADYATVYLSTRSTNHASVVSFYKRVGMRVIQSEVAASDLLDSHEAGKNLHCTLGIA